MSNNKNQNGIIVDITHYFNIIDNIQENTDKKYSNSHLMSLVKHILTPDLITLLLNAFQEDINVNSWVQLQKEFVYNNTLDKAIVITEELHRIIKLVKRFEDQEPWVEERVRLLYKVCIDNVFYILDNTDKILDYTNTGIKSYNKSKRKNALFLFYDFRVNEMNSNAKYLSRNKYDKLNDVLYFNGVILADIINNNKNDVRLDNIFYQRFNLRIIKRMLDVNKY